VTARNLFVVLVCIGAAIIESTLPVMLPASLWSMRADLLLAVVLYLAFHDEWVQGAGLAFFTGCLSDLSASTPPGIYAFLAVLTFVIVRVTGSAFRAEGGVQAAAVAFGASLVYTLLATIIFRILFAGSKFAIHVNWLASAFATGLGAIFIFAILRRLDASLLPAGETLGPGAKARAR
jgi:rod shape-determining protein MreD